MIKNISIAFFLASIISLGCIAIPIPHAKKNHNDIDVRLHKECLYPVVKLTEVGKNIGSSGFVVRSERIRVGVYLNVFLTCKHCVDEDDQEVSVFNYEDWSYVRNITRHRCVFYGVDEKLDIAIGYFLSDQPIPTVVLDKDVKMYIGSDIFKIGCGLGNDPRLDLGKITQPIRQADVEKEYIRHNAVTIPGDSGCPLFYRYKVVGINNYIKAWHGMLVWNVAYAVPIGRVYQWSKSNDGFYDSIFESTVPIHKMPLHRLDIINRYEIIN